MDRDVSAHRTGWEQPLTYDMSYSVLMVSSLVPKEDGSGLLRTQGRCAGCRYLVLGVRGGAAGSSVQGSVAPSSLGLCVICFPGEKHLEGVETTRDAVKTNCLRQVEMLCGDTGNPLGWGALHLACKCHCPRCHPPPVSVQDTGQDVRPQSRSARAVWAPAPRAHKWTRQTDRWTDSSTGCHHSWPRAGLSWLVFLLWLWVLLSSSPPFPLGAFRYGRCKRMAGCAGELLCLQASPAPSNTRLTPNDRL